MRRRGILPIAFAMLALWACPISAQVVSPVGISHAAASAAGLDSAWTTIVTVDPAKSRLVGLVLHKGVLFASTSQGTVQAIDAETGATYWTTRVGRPDYITLPPGANDTHVIVSNGTQLFALERRTGRFLWQRRTHGAPSAGPAVSDDRCYVPMYSGAIEAYRLRDEVELDKDPTIFFAAGASMAPPVVREDRIFWSSKDGGFVYGDDFDKSTQRFRFTTGGPVYGGVAVFQTGKANPIVFAGSYDGSLYAIADPDGSLVWRYQAGSPITHAPVVIEDAVYAISDGGILSRINIATGVARWQAAGIKQFLAASAGRVYVTDLTGHVLALDAGSGGLMASVFAGTSVVPMMNDVTDRIYLVSTTGRIQCLHEKALSKPLVHAPPAPPAAAAPMPMGTEGAPPAAAGASPFGNQ